MTVRISNETVTKFELGVGSGSVHDEAGGSQPFGPLVDVIGHEGDDDAPRVGRTVVTDPEIGIRGRSIDTTCPLITHEFEPQEPAIEVRRAFELGDVHERDLCVER